MAERRRCGYGPRFVRGGGLFLCLFMAWSAQALASTGMPTERPIFPAPVSLSAQHGVSSLAHGVQIVWDTPPSPLLKQAEVRFQARLQRLIGKTTYGKPYFLHIRSGRSAGYLSVKMDERYHVVTKAQRGDVVAHNPAGVLHGLVTFLQLVRERAPDMVASNQSSGPVVLWCSIEDAPRFAWRGVLLDVARHFVTVEEIKRQLDCMELTKLNVLHWHLSDGVAFRVESKVFPKLSAIGGHGAYYTQRDVREVVAYARDRGIRVVPEFDMPGHMLAILQAYPALAAQPVPNPLPAGQNANNAAMDPTTPQHRLFLRAFYGEMLSLFPDSYVHVGGDEVVAAQWQDNPRIVDFMKTHQMRDTVALQASFSQELARLLAQKKRVMMGWDDLSEAPLSSQVALEVWRSSKWTAYATQQGHDVVVSAGYYLDKLQPAEAYYAVDPTDPQADGLTPDMLAEAHLKPTPFWWGFVRDQALLPLSAEQKKHVLGGEAALWSEAVLPSMLEERLWPRTAAVAERLWSPAAQCDPTTLIPRLQALTAWLEALGAYSPRARESLKAALAPGHEQALTIFLQTIVPVPNYGLNVLLKAKGESVLHGVVGLASPDAPEATTFNALALRYAAGERGLMPLLRDMLCRWQSAAQQWGAYARTQPSLATDAVTAGDVARMTRAGLAALSDSGKNSPGPGALSLIQTYQIYAQTTQNMLLVKKRPLPPSGLLIALTPGVEALVQAARPLDTGTR